MDINSSALVVGGSVLVTVEDYKASVPFLIHLYLQMQEDADREGPPYRVDMVSTISEQEVHQKTTFLVCVSGPNDEEQVNTVSEECKEEKEKLEFVRRKYLASVIAAREKPVGESLLMVAECRRQLNNYLTDIPFMAFFGSERH